VILVGTAFWGPVVEWLRTTLVDAGTISPHDLELLTVTDDLDEMLRVIRACVECHTPPPGGGVPR